MWLFYILKKCFVKFSSLTCLAVLHVITGNISSCHISPSEILISLFTSLISFLDYRHFEISDCVCIADYPSASTWSHARRSNQHLKVEWFVSVGINGMWYGALVAKIIPLWAHAWFVDNGSHNFIIFEPSNKSDFLPLPLSQLKTKDALAQNQQSEKKINQRPLHFTWVLLVLHIQMCSIVCNREKWEIMQVSMNMFMIEKILEYHADIRRKKKDNYKLIWKHDKEI